jgi:hypothetical protein
MCAKNPLLQEPKYTVVLSLSPKRFVSAMLFLLIVGKRNYKMFWVPQKAWFRKKFRECRRIDSKFVVRILTRKPGWSEKYDILCLGRKIRRSRLKYVWCKYDAKPGSHHLINRRDNGSVEGQAFCISVVYNRSVLVIILKLSGPSVSLRILHGIRKC